MPVDPSAFVAPTARVHPDAIIGAQCHIGEFCVVESDVVLGNFCRLEPYVFVKRFTTMGEANEISAGTALGTDPLDKNFSGARSYLVMGSRNRIREHFTISRGTQPESSTVIGDDNYVMTSGHIAHNAVIGSHTVIASCSLVSGYVEVGDRAFISGGVVVHQYSKIGRLAMIGGNTRVNRDVPPYFLGVGFHVEAVGPNPVGMKRAGFTLKDVRSVKFAIRTLYLQGLPRADALAELETGDQATDITREIATFVRASKRGICWARRKGGASEGDAPPDD
ncbi:MAG: acyl-ACP--UDP-N-acetylglucosamine O-acyltransferase [Bryobacterales bacterium]|nr:acyl-ACP--UDP-N-acetylglucosamine O-acyltransferase [Bryobacterales bacterium]